MWCLKFLLSLKAIVTAWGGHGDVRVVQLIVRRVSVEVVVDDVIKNVDEAIRIRIYHNGESTTYAKKSNLDDTPEQGTTPFRNIKDAESSIILEEVNNFQPGQRDRITVVVWLEGDDPDCTDPLIGGELKMHMVITENHTEPKEE